jgi:hypothetical protein
MFDNVMRYGMPLTREVVKMNEFVENVSFRYMGDCSQSRTKDEGLSLFGILVHLEGDGENNTMISHLDMVAKMGARWNRVDFTWKKPLRATKTGYATGMYGTHARYHLAGRTPDAGYKIAGHSALGKAEFFM